MTKMILSLAAASAMVMAGGDLSPVEVVSVETVEAFTGVYVGGALTGVSTGLGGDTGVIFDNDTSTFGVQGNIGYTFFNNGSIAVSAEARAGTNFADDSDVELAYVAGYVKPEAIFGDLGIYGLVGYGTVDYNANPRITLSADSSVDDFTWGLGAQWLVAENISVFADYVALPSLNLVDVETGYAGTLINENSVDTDVVSVGLNYRF